jgi:hypothetical protein
MNHLEQLNKKITFLDNPVEKLVGFLSMKLKLEDFSRFFYEITPRTMRDLQESTLMPSSHLIAVVSNARYFDGRGLGVKISQRVRQ